MPKPRYDEAQLKDLLLQMMETGRFDSRAPMRMMRWLCAGSRARSATEWRMFHISAQGRGAANCPTVAARLP